MEESRRKNDNEKGIKMGIKDRKKARGLIKEEGWGRVEEIKEEDKKERRGSYDNVEEMLIKMKRKREEDIGDEGEGEEKVVERIFKRSKRTPRLPGANVRVERGKVNEREG